MEELKRLSILSQEGTLKRECRFTLEDPLLIQGYKVMMKTRAIDERMITLQRQGIITFALSSLGEEACAVATAAALDLSDWIYPQYRESGALFWRGFSTEDYLHQMFGDAKDLIKGRQMPNHFGSRELNVVTVSSPIATKIPHAAGAAYAMKLQNEKSLALCFFGEGATSEGDFHVGLNFAAVRSAPAIFFCRNNGYAISTATDKQFATDGVAIKGASYGMKTYLVDGNDFFALYEVVKEAKEYCLSGKGPVLIEAMTYRMGAHSTSDDPTRYRPKEEVESWKKKDPIRRLKRYLEEKKVWDEEKESALIQSLKEEIDAAIEVAKSTPPPPIGSMTEDLYAEEDG